MSSPLIISGRTDIKLYYPFNEGTGTTLYDYSGNGYNGTITGTTIIKTTNGNRCKIFNGSSDFIQTSDNSDLDGGSAITILAWVRGSSFNQYPRIVEKGTNEAYRLQPSNNNNGIPRCNIYVSSTGYNLDATTDIEDGEWHLIGFTYDGSTLKIYVDAVLENSDSSMSGAIDTTTADVYIGVREDKLASTYFAGELNDFLFYNKTLTLAEIQAIYRETYRV